MPAAHHTVPHDDDHNQHDHDHQHYDHDHFNEHHDDHDDVSAVGPLVHVRRGESQRVLQRDVREQRGFWAVVLQSGRRAMRRG
jgi:hypothetical protein